MRGSINERMGGAFKKPPENAIKLRESQLSHHLKPTQIMLKRKRFFTAIYNHLTLVLTQLEEGGGEGRGAGELTSHMGGCFFLESSFTFKSAPLL